MRHAKHKYSLNRSYSLRKALVTSMVKNLLIYERIRTTLTRAKAARPIVEKLIAMGKRATLADKRRAFQILGDHRLVSRLCNDIAARFKDRSGGFTRILTIGSRRGDDARIAIFELTEIKEKKKKQKPEKEAKTAAEPKPEITKEKPGEEIKPKAEKPAHERIPERPAAPKKPAKKFLGGIRSIFKKERDSL